MVADSYLPKQENCSCFEKMSHQHKKKNQQIDLLADKCVKDSNSETKNTFPLEIESKNADIDINILQVNDSCEIKSDRRSDSALSFNIFKDNPFNSDYEEVDDNLIYFSPKYIIIKKLKLNCIGKKKIIFKK